MPALASSLAAESGASKAQQEMERLQQQVAAVKQQLEEAKEAAGGRKAAERDVEGRLEDAKAQLQVGVLAQEAEQIHGAGAVMSSIS